MAQLPPHILRSWLDPERYDTTQPSCRDKVYDKLIRAQEEFEFLNTLTIPKECVSTRVASLINMGSIQRLTAVVETIKAQGNKVSPRRRKAKR